MGDPNTTVSNPKDEELENVLLTNDLSFIMTNKLEILPAED